jgi:hypothetical protein
MDSSTSLSEARHQDNSSVFSIGVLFLNIHIFLISSFLLKYHLLFFILLFPFRLPFLLVLHPFQLLYRLILLFFSLVGSMLKASRMELEEVAVAT